MSTCPNCRQQYITGDRTEKPKSIYKWFGMYTLCDTCNDLYFRRWDSRSMAAIILAVVLFQFLASLMVLPALQYLVASDALRLTVFTMFHLVSLPFYTLLSISLTLNAR